MSIETKNGEWRIQARGDCSMGDLPRQIHIGEFRIGCIFVKVYIYIIFGEGWVSKEF